MATKEAEALMHARRMILEITMLSERNPYGMFRIGPSVVTNSR